MKRREKPLTPASSRNPASSSTFTPASPLLTDSTLYALPNYEELLFPDNAA